MIRRVRGPHNLLGLKRVALEEIDEIELKFSKGKTIAETLNEALVWQKLPNICSPPTVCGRRKFAFERAPTRPIALRR